MAHQTSHPSHHIMTQNHPAKNKKEMPPSRRTGDTASEKAGLRMRIKAIAPQTAAASQGESASMTIPVLILPA